MSIKYWVCVVLIVMVFGCKNSDSTLKSLITGGTLSASYQGDPSNCGAPNNLCTGTQPACCNGSCVDLVSLENCGACGASCPSSGNCEVNPEGVGVCHSLEALWGPSGPPDCTLPQLFCGCFCSNGFITQTCSHVCPTTCSAGICPGRTPPATSLGACSASSEADYNQNCAIIVPSNRVTICIPPSATCLGKCLNIMSDPQNCGQCGHVCPADAPSCWGGICQNVSGAILPASIGSTPSLSNGQEITSQNGLYKLSMQVDGNLVLYFIKSSTNSYDAQPLWASGTYTSNSTVASQYTASMTPSGNLVVSDSTGSNIFNTYLYNPVYGSSLILQNDGNLIIYDNLHQVRWQTHTGGQLRCQSPLTLCESSCVDTSSDANNCGSCGNTCNSNTTNACVNGICKCVAAGVTFSACSGCTSECNTAGCTQGNGPGCPPGQTCYQGYSPNNGAGQCR